jgi:hypothetical protein
MDWSALPLGYWKIRNKRIDLAMGLRLYEAGGMRRQIDL